MDLGRFLMINIRLDRHMPIRYNFMIVLYVYYVAINIDTYFFTYKIIFNTTTYRYHVKRQDIGQHVRLIITSHIQ